MIEVSKYNIYKTIEQRNFVYNTFSGAIVQMNTEELQALKNNHIDKLQSEAVELLLDQGIICEEGKEFELVRKAYDCFQNRHESNIIIATTLECNFCCPYCFEKNKKGVMTNEVREGVYSFVKRIVEQRKISKLSVDFFGGEPTLYPLLMIEMVNKLEKIAKENELPIEFTVTTNGYKITRELVDLFKNHRFKEIKITIDGDKKTHDTRRILKNHQGTFDIIYKNILSLENANIPVKLRVNIDRGNEKAFEDVKRRFGSMKNIYIYPAIVTRETNQNVLQQNKCFSEHDKKSFYESLDNELLHVSYDDIQDNIVPSCIAECHNSYVVDCNGYLYKCVNDIGVTSSAISTVFDEETNDQVYFRYLTRQPWNEAPCNECVYFPRCYGGCVYDVATNGEHRCTATKYLIDKIVENKIKSLMREEV